MYCMCIIVETHYVNFKNVFILTSNINKIQTITNTRIMRKSLIKFYTFEFQYSFLP